MGRKVKPQLLADLQHRERDGFFRMGLVQILRETARQHFPILLADVLMNAVVAHNGEKVPTQIHVKQHAVTLGGLVHVELGEKALRMPISVALEPAARQVYADLARGTLLGSRDRVDDGRVLDQLLSTSCHLRLLHLSVRRRPRIRRLHRRPNHHRRSRLHPPNRSARSIVGRRDSKDSGDTSRRG